MIHPHIAAHKHSSLQRKLDRNIPLEQKLALIHEAIKRHSPHIHRIAVALYSKKTDQLSTFLYSSSEKSPLLNYSIKLEEVPSLQVVARQGEPRVLNDLAIQSAKPGLHSRRLLAHGYHASLTYPVYHDDTLFGFIFFNSRQKNVFTPALLDLLNLFSQVVASQIIRETTFVHTMTAAIRTAQNITRHKDEETGCHLQRMAHYSRLIAAALAEQNKFNDEFIEYIHLFAPMHDIGKIAIPDHILSKPGKLDPDEFDMIKGHSGIGREIIDNMVKEFAFSGFLHIEMLRNIVEFHHEALDGSGYPHGLKGAEIPIEARICAVADIFDALTNQRPYKPAWSNEKACAVLLEMAEAGKLDRDCVQALVGNMEKVREIQAHFAEEPENS
ncbi:GAF domain-containing protein [Formivibrio citricus]|uniref:GAF domain-containing protein n=1 Tax=Formivibrio citricus TaxID=83765 RepID=A0A1I5A5Q8_9NEIS|nr:HD domain-containing phosphohydrolase [Formivibrio citricus]SFN57901.1 GAF domain-containing protein [Formivibrio citricus]